MAPVKLQFITADSCKSEFGAQTRIFNFLNFLALRGFDIKFTMVNHAGPSEPLPELAAKRLAPGIEVWRNTLTSSGIANIVLRARRACAGLSAPMKRAFRSATRLVGGRKSWQLSPIARRFVTRCVEEWESDVVVADYTFLADTLDLVPQTGNCLKVILTHEVLHLVAEDLDRGQIEHDHAGWTRESEGAALRKADVLIASCEEDQEAIGAIAPDCRTILCPLGMRYHSHEPSEQVPGRCLFVGSSTPFTVDCLQRFLVDVWPRVTAACPGSQLHVVGGVGGALLEAFPGARRLSNVIIRGRVADLAPEYGAAEVCIAPISVPRGVKIKVMEALSHGRAVVATSMGLDGARTVVDRAILAADTPGQFAEAVVRVLTDRGQRLRMESAAREFCLNTLHPDQAYQPFLDVVERHMLEKAQRRRAA